MILCDGNNIDWVHMAWAWSHGAQLGTRAKPGNHLDSSY